MNKATISILLPFIGGIFYALGFPCAFFNNHSLFFGPLLGVCLLLFQFPLFSQDTFPGSLKRAALATLAFSLGLNGVGFYWIPETIKVFGQIPSPFHHLIGLLFTPFVVPQYWVFLVLSFLIKKYWKWPYTLPLPTLHLFWTLLLTFCEYLTPQQFPAHVGHPWLVFAPHLALAPIFGAPLFSFMSFWLALSLLSYVGQKKVDVLAPATALVVILLNAVSPLSPLPKDPSKKLGVRVVQANIGNYLKTISESGHRGSIQSVMRLYSQLSVEGARALDLIIWPETAYPHPLYSPLLYSHEKNRPSVFRHIQMATGAEILFGGYDQNKNQNSLQSGSDPDYETLYNAAFFLGEDGKLKGVYHKQKLIPFGETLPFGPLNSLLSRYVDNISYFSKGDSHTLFQTRKGDFFVVAICYELLFSDYIREIFNTVSNRPHFLINLTNDSWYGDTSEPAQHLFLAKWRALEFALPIIRSTNTGLTSVLYPDGSESSRLTLNSKGSLDLELPLLDHPKTFFEKWGVSAIIPLWVILWGLSWLPLFSQIYFLTKNPSLRRS